MERNHHDIQNMLMGYGARNEPVVSDLPTAEDLLIAAPAEDQPATAGILSTTARGVAEDPAELPAAPSTSSISAPGAVEDPLSVPEVMAFIIPSDMVYLLDFSEAGLPIAVPVAAQVAPDNRTVFPEAVVYIEGGPQAAIPLDDFEEHTWEILRGRPVQQDRQARTRLRQLFRTLYAQFRHAGRRHHE